MNRRAISILALSLIISTALICFAQSAIAQGYDLTKDPSDQTLGGFSSNGPNQPGSTSGQPMQPPSGVLSAGEPPATTPKLITSYSPPPRFEQMPGSKEAFPNGPGFMLESWDMTTPWTTDPISLPKGTTWWWRLTNPNTQNVYFDLNAGMWKAYKKNPLSQYYYIGTYKLTKPGWAYIIAWGSENAYSNPIWCYVKDSSKLQIQIKQPVSAGSTPKSVTINYNVNQDCVVQFIVNMPDGPFIDNPTVASKGTNIYTYDDPGPSGRRQIVGLAWTADDCHVDMKDFLV